MAPTTELPEIKEEKIETQLAKANLYTLTYLQQRNVLTKNFFLKGDLHKAIARGKSHCENKGYRFLFVRPFLSDLDLDEKEEFSR